MNVCVPVCACACACARARACVCVCVCVSVRIFFFKDDPGKRPIHRCNFESSAVSYSYDIAPKDSVSYFTDQKPSKFV